MDGGGKNGCEADGLDGLCGNCSAAVKFQRGSLGLQIYMDPGRPSSAMTYNSATSSVKYSTPISIPSLAALAYSFRNRE